MGTKSRMVQKIMHGYNTTLMLGEIDHAMHEMSRKKYRTNFDQVAKRNNGNVDQNPINNQNFIGTFVA